MRSLYKQLFQFKLIDFWVDAARHTLLKITNEEIENNYLHLDCQVFGHDQ